MEVADENRITVRILRSEVRECRRCVGRRLFAALLLKALEKLLEDDPLFISRKNCFDQALMTSSFIVSRCAKK